MWVFKEYTMVYSNKFVVCVLLNGVPQQELANGVVKLPFETEYGLRFRNKHNRRAVVKIFIDGENVSGGGYVIPANDHIDIKRHWDKDRAFKFVSLDSSDAVDAGKNGPNPDKEKGLIEAHFYLEKEVNHHYYPYPMPWVKEEHHHHHHYPKPDPWPNYPIRPIWHTNANFGATADNAKYSCNHIPVISSDESQACGFESADQHPKLSNPYVGGQHTNSTKTPRACGSRMAMPRVKMTNEAVPATTNVSFNTPTPELKDGCTVLGESTGQRFTTVHIDLEDTCTTLKLFLQGWEAEQVRHVNEPPVKPKKKDQKIDDLEAENEELRRQLAEIENSKLKRKLARVKKKKTNPDS
jgi:hypothetical protein